MTTSDRDAASPAETTAKKHSGASVIVGFLPWIIYWILSGNTAISTAVLVALILSIVNNANQYRRDHELIALEAGTTVWFAMALVMSYTISDEWLLRWMSPLSNLAFFGVMLFTAIIRKPFTVQYAKQSTPPEIWDTPGFMYVNWTLTWVWIGSTAAMTAISLIPSLVDSDASLTSNDPLNIACYWVLPYGLLGLTVVFTARFPDWFGSAFDDVDPSTEPAAAPPIGIDGTTDQPAIDGFDITVEPRDTLLDEVPSLRAAGAVPGSTVTLSTTTVDLVGHTWRAEATFAADADGVVDPSVVAPSTGSYSGVDAAGLLWSMRFATPGATPDIFVPSIEPAGVSVAATAGGRTVTATIVRRSLPADATITDVRTDDVVGRLFLPRGDGPFPGVVLIGGSEGGIDSMASDAAVLAAHGRAALVVGLFGAPGLDDTLSTVPLERVQRGVQHLAGHPAVDASRLGAMAISRGAEALLVAAARFELPLTDLVAISPSSVLWPAETDAGASPDTSAWTIGGEQQAFVPVDQEPIMGDMGRQALRARGRHHLARPPVMHLTRSYGKSLDEAGPDVIDAARIPVERVGGRLLLVVGADDQVWPSGRMAADLSSRRGRAGEGDQTLRLDGCGHLVRLGVFPTDVAWTGGIALGGTPSGIAAAQRRTTDAVLAWLP